MNSQTELRIQLLICRLKQQFLFSWLWTLIHGLCVSCSLPVLFCKLYLSALYCITSFKFPAIISHTCFQSVVAQSVFLQPSVHSFSATLSGITSCLAFQPLVPHVCLLVFFSLFFCLQPWLYRSPCVSLQCFWPSFVPGLPDFACSLPVPLPSWPLARVRLHCWIWRLCCLLCFLCLSHSLSFASYTFSHFHFLFLAAFPYPVS